MNYNEVMKFMLLYSSISRSLELKLEAIKRVEE